MREQMHLDHLRLNYRDGDKLGWENEFAWIRRNHAAKVRNLTRSILNEGIRTPILLGDDGRVRDGHHRLYVAYAMGFEYVPVEHARAEP